MCRGIVFFGVLWFFLFQPRPIRQNVEDVIFAFRKISESEMLIAGEFRDKLRRTREGLAGNR